MKIITRKKIDPQTFEPVLEDLYFMRAGEWVECIDDRNQANLTAGRRYLVLEDQEGSARINVLTDNDQFSDYYRFRFRAVARVKAGLRVVADPEELKKSSVAFIQEIDTQ